MTDVDITISVGRKEPSAFRLVATLVVAAALSGLALASVFQVTKPIIDANDAEALRQAIFTVVPGSTTMQPLVLRDGVLVVISPDETTGEPIIYAAYDENAVFLGYAIPGSTPGFQDTIRILYGYDPTARRVIGMEVLESRETPGLGDKIWKDESFVANFSALAVDPSIEVVKDGRDADNEVDAITGATISSKAVVKIINEGNERWLDLLPPPGEEPPFAPPAEPDSQDSTIAEED